MTGQTQKRQNFRNGIAIAGILLSVFAAFLAGYYYITKTVLASNMATMEELLVHEKTAIHTSIYYRWQQAHGISEALSSQSVNQTQQLFMELDEACIQMHCDQILLLGDDNLFYGSDYTAKTDLEYQNLAESNPDGFVLRVDSSSKHYNEGSLIIGMPTEKIQVGNRSFRYIISVIKLETLADELNITSFDGQGRCFIIDEAGNIVISAEDNFTNYFDLIKGARVTNYNDIDAYKKAIVEEETTSSIITINRVQYIALSTRTEEGWILISFCPKSIFSDQSNRLTLVLALDAIAMVGVAVGVIIILLHRDSKRKLEAQLKEIKGLNQQLSEKQTNLEVAAREKEEQFEKIEFLNADLSRRMDIIESMSKIYFATYYFDLVDGTFEEVVSKDSVRAVVGRNGDVQRALYLMCDHLILPEFREKILKFVDLSTLDERMKDKIYITEDYIGVTSGWSMGYFIEGDRDENGKLRHVFYASRVIHEEKERELRMRQLLEDAKNQAEAANNAKTAFLFNMSHDIRTPMNAIIGFTNLLEKYQDDPQKRQDYLGKINGASAVLLSIINNVLEMARIEKGTITLEEVAWNAEQFNDTLFSVLCEMMDQKGIEFTRSIDVEHTYVLCDPIKLREIYINILSNAYKYTNPGGKVRMDLKEIPSTMAGYAFYQTTISDTGIGMSPEYLPHIFEEFSRENNTTENKIEGTGLGMPIVNRLVELMGGTIEVTSEQGVGTTFVVMIPHKISEQSALVNVEGVELDPKLFEGKRILLVEDNDLNAEIAFEILGGQGFLVERAEDGAVAVKKMEESEAGHYDVILMDIQMPNMNGYEATKAIRGMMDTSKNNIPIIAMTANAFEEDKREAMKAGMNDHLAKPVKVSELMKTLARFLQ